MCSVCSALINALGVEWDKMVVIKAKQNPESKKKGTSSEGLHAWNQNYALKWKRKGNLSVQISSAKRKWPRPIKNRERVKCETSQTTLLTNKIND